MVNREMQISVAKKERYWKFIFPKSFGTKNFFFVLFYVLFCLTWKNVCRKSYQKNIAMTIFKLKLRLNGTDICWYFWVMSKSDAGWYENEIWVLEQDLANNLHQIGHQSLVKVHEAHGARSIRRLWSSFTVGN